MLVDRTVLHLIHGIKLTLEQHKIASAGRVLIKYVVLEALEGVDYLEEVAVSEEVLVIFLVCLLYNSNPV